jgi:predicted RNA-binding Zn-ribbon protein involved in translation (DUF1610 family)
MGVIDKYSRPYCKNCELIYGIGSIGYLKYCTQCGRPLIMKSFNPWYKFWGGVALITTGAITVFFSVIPIVWIGAFIWGFSLMINSFRQWRKIKKLDEARESQFVETKYKVRETQSKKDDKNHVVITCGACSHKIRVRRGQGIIKIRCPNCGRESRIMT